MFTPSASPKYIQRVKMKRKGASWLPALAPRGGQRTAGSGERPRRHLFCSSACNFPRRPAQTPAQFPQRPVPPQPGSCQPHCGCTKHNHCNLTGYFCFEGRRGFFLSELWVEALQRQPLCNGPLGNVNRADLSFSVVCGCVKHGCHRCPLEGFSSSSELGV